LILVSLGFLDYQLDLEFLEDLEFLVALEFLDYQ
jgi:hypothetical protein